MPSIIWTRSLGLAREWLALSVMLLTLCGALTYSGVLRRADLSFFDMSARLVHANSTQKIAVVAIDDKTLSALGGPPLRRSIDAALVDRLTESGVVAVGLDIIIAQKGRIDPNGDERLAEAIRRNGNVVTRLVTRNIDGSTSALLPPAPIYGASNSSGLVDVHPDRDGVIRSFYLSEGNVNGFYDDMAYLLLRASGARMSPCRDDNMSDADDWSAACLRYVPLGHHRSYERFSYLDVLRGAVPASSLRGRIVIVGETASDGDARLATAMVDGSWLTGVEFLAEELNALENGTLVRPAGNVCQILFNVSVIPLLCVGLFFLGPWASLVASIFLAMASILIAFGLLSIGHVLVFPSAAIATCVIAYPIWSWRRQEALLRYLSVEVERVMNEPSLPDEPGIMLRIMDPIQRRLTVMTNMVARVRRYRDFVSEWVNSLPEATLIASSSGIVVLANERAGALAAGGERTGETHASLTGRDVADVLFEMTSSHRATSFVALALEHLSESADDNSSSVGGEAALAQGIEMIDGQQRSLLIKCATIQASLGRDGALIFHVADVTSMRKAERQRDVTLRFLAHDLRSPQAAILALVEQMRHYPDDFPDDSFPELVAQYATSALNLADDFLFLVQAESQPSRLAELDLALLLGDAIDDLWPQARARGTAVQFSAEPGKIVVADVHLLRRAFANIIGNAIKFSPMEATVNVAVEELSTKWQVSVTDEGVGMGELQKQQLFREFCPLGAGAGAYRPGHGLGLAFVKTVLDVLGGQIFVQSTLNVGSTFTVLLPKVSKM
jgi:signal transduction histidine kinase